MLNNIDSIRKDIINHFDPQGRIEGSEVVKLSESGLYYYSCTLFKQKDAKRDGIVSQIEIWDTEAAVKIFDYLTDNDMSHYNSWWIILSDKHEYLFLAEAQTGYSVFDVSNCQLYSFNLEDDPFIWMEMHLSPDGTKLVVEGSYWACPGELRVYDVANITKLPYPILYTNEFYTRQCGFKFDKWHNNHSFYLQDINNGNITTVLIPELEVEIYYLTTEEGGRKTPVRNGYRGQFYYDDCDWDAKQEFINIEECAPGQSVRAYLKTLSPEYHHGKFFEGKEFEIREGARVVGKGKVLKVLCSDFQK